MGAYNGPCISFFRAGASTRIFYMSPPAPFLALSFASDGDDSYATHAAGPAFTCGAGPFTSGPARGRRGRLPPSPAFRALRGARMAGRVIFTRAGELKETFPCLFSGPLCFSLHRTVMMVMIQGRRGRTLSHGMRYRHVVTFRPRCRPGIPYALRPFCCSPSVLSPNHPRSRTGVFGQKSGSGVLWRGEDSRTPDPIYLIPQYASG